MLRNSRTLIRSLATAIAAAPAIVMAQYSETKIGEYLHYAVAAASGGVYAGYDSINFASPSLYTPALGWVDLPYSAGFDTSYPYYGYTTGISRDGSIVSGYAWGTSNGAAVQYAAYWVNGSESLVPAPPDDANASIMSATGISADGSTLLVQDQTGSKVETYVFKIATQTFTSLGYLGTTVQQTYASATNKDGSIVSGYCNLDNGNADGFLWTAPTGLKNLGIPPNHPNTVYLEPTCMSDDGTTVFGALTELNGWIGFRYNTKTGFQDTAGIVPHSCSADGTETVGIENFYFPAIWTVANGGGYLDHLLSAHGIAQPLGTIGGPVTISPDDSLVTAIGPDVYLADQIWYGTWQIKLPAPLKTAPIAPKLLYFSTGYMTTLNAPAGSLIQYAEFNTKASALLVTPPAHASSFVLNANGSFSYTPMKGYGDRTDSFTYRLLGPHGHSNVGQAQIFVASHISRLNPASVAVGSPDTLVTVIGAGFVSTDWITVNGTALGTTFISSTELQLTIPASYLAVKGPVRLTVEGASNTATLYVK